MVSKEKYIKIISRKNKIFKIIRTAKPFKNIKTLLGVVGDAWIIYIFCIIYIFIFYNEHEFLRVRRVKLCPKVQSIEGVRWVGWDAFVLLGCTVTMGSDHSLTQ